MELWRHASTRFWKWNHPVDKTEDVIFPLHLFYPWWKEHSDIWSSCIPPFFPLGPSSYPQELLLHSNDSTPTCVTRWLAICCCGCWTCWGCWGEGCCWDCPTTWPLIVCWPLGGLYIAGVPSGFTNGWPETKHPALAGHFQEHTVFCVKANNFALTDRSSAE